MSKRKSTRQGADGAVYTREQKGHSLTGWIIAALFVVGIPGLIYYSVSPNHYWHA